MWLQMKQNLLEGVLVAALGYAAMGYVIWAIEGHIHSGWLLTAGAVVVAPPTALYLLYLVWPNFPVQFFWATFFMLECIYLSFLVGLAKRRFRRT